MQKTNYLNYLNVEYIYTTHIIMITIIKSKQ